MTSSVVSVTIDIMHISSVAISRRQA